MTKGANLVPKLEICGLANLQAVDKEKVRMGNMCLASSVRILQAAAQSQTPAWLENPVNSMHWQAPRLQRPLVSSRTLVLDFCQYGTAWR